MKKILFVLFFTLAYPLYSQTVIINNEPNIFKKEKDNSAETERKYKTADHFSAEAQKALDDREYEKALYYLDQWSHMGKVDDRYYIQIADVLLAQNKPEAAKRHLMKAYNKYGCFECKGKAIKINTDGNSFNANSVSSIAPDDDSTLSINKKWKLVSANGGESSKLKFDVRNRFYPDGTYISISKNLENGETINSSGKYELSTEKNEIVFFPNKGKTSKATIILSLKTLEIIGDDYISLYDLEE